MSETVESAESSDIPTEYRDRVEELNETIRGLAEIDARFEDDRPETGGELAIEAIELVEEKMGSIDLPDEPEKEWPFRQGPDEERSTITSPEGEGDYVTLEVEWWVGGIRVRSWIMPDAAGYPIAYYWGLTKNASEDELEEHFSRIESRRKKRGDAGSR